MGTASQALETTVRYWPFLFMYYFNSLYAI